MYITLQNWEFIYMIFDYWSLEITYFSLLFWFHVKLWWTRNCCLVRKISYMSFRPKDMSYIFIVSLDCILHFWFWYINPNCFECLIPNFSFFHLPCLISFNWLNKTWIFSKLLSIYCPIYSLRELLFWNDDKCILIGPYS